jgi:hypothetical protein
MGHVTVNEHAPSEKFNQFVDEKVRNWIGDHEGADVQQSDYEVAFFDEEMIGEVSCLVVIHCGGQLWRAWESGDNPRSALQRGLEQLVVDEDASATEAIASTPLPAH